MLTKDQIANLKVGDMLEYDVPAHPNLHGRRVIVVKVGEPEPQGCTFIYEQRTGVGGGQHNWSWDYYRCFIIPPTDDFAQQMRGILGG